MHVFLIYFLILCLFNLCFGSSFYDVNACGKIPKQIKRVMPSFIMNGNNTLENEYPFVVAIFNKDEYICTGSLISPRHVITAAHCFASSNTETFLDKKCGEEEECRKRYLPSNAKEEKCQNGYLNPETIIQDYEIGYGSHRLNKTQKLKLESIDPIYQQFYFSGCLQNDFAILTLALNETQEAQRQYACLFQTTAPTFNIYNNNIKFTTLGWGKDHYFFTDSMFLAIKNIPRNEILQKLNVGNLLSMNLCLDSWKPFPVDGICVKETDSKNTCDGDSGGPLIAIYQSRYVMVGFLSFGTSCDLLRENVEAKTAVYTRLDFYQQKLNEIIEWRNENFDGLNFNGFY